jgi:flagellar motility protein MotE (MotC chaperone)
MSAVVKSAVIGIAVLAGAKTATTMDVSISDMQIAISRAAQIAMAEGASEEGDVRETSKKLEIEADPQPKREVRQPRVEPSHINGIPELLVDISAEKDALKLRQHKVDEREAELRLYEAAVVEQIRQLKTLRDEIDRLLAGAGENHVQDVTRLVNMYKAMKPGQAAAILNDADIAVSVQVVAAMKERDSGPVLAEMNPARARVISKIIYERSRLPGDQDLIGLDLR